MTTLNISMTSALQETLSHPGAYAYAVYFNSASGALQSGTVVVSNGVVVNSGTASAGVTSVGLPGTYVGGKVYFIIQSIDPTSSSGIFSGSPGSAVVAGTITSQSQISWDTATANDFRYDSFCKGTSNGVAVFETKSFIISGTGLFQSWSFNSASSNLTAAGGPNATGANITLGGVPYATSVNWYQLTVASGSVSRTYDYYLDAVAGCPQSLLQRRQPVRVDLHSTISRRSLPYSSSGPSGTLTVSDGTHVAHLQLIGTYTLANFTSASDGHGGTQITDPPVSSGQSALASS